MDIRIFLNEGSPIADLLEKRLDGQDDVSSAYEKKLLSAFRLNKGRLESRWSDWFEGMTIVREGAFTSIKGKVPDHPALHGLLVRIRDLGLPLISVERVQSEQKTYRGRVKN